MRGDLRAVDVRRVGGHVGRVEQVERKRPLDDEELLLARVVVVTETRTQRGVLLAGDDTHAEGRAVGPRALRLLDRATFVVADGLERGNGQLCSHQRPPDVECRILRRRWSGTPGRRYPKLIDIISNKVNIVNIP